jgi:hypothetical protein
MRASEQPDPPPPVDLRQFAMYHRAFCEFKRVEANGLFRQWTEHVCGLSGFGALGDTCPGCQAPPIDRTPNCTCGLHAALNRAAAPQRQEPPSHE